jgi:protoheme IX farnesyltransferase
MSMESAAETAGGRVEPEVGPGGVSSGAAALRRGPGARRHGRSSALGVVRDYVALTKPRIISLLLLTTVASMFVADPSGPPISTILWTMLGGYLAAGGAGAINHYIDREADARMARTRTRPLASGRIEPLHGLIFGVLLGSIAIVQLALTVNELAAALSLAGLLGYVFVYTLWLKPLTAQNIVIGGSAGAVPPLVGWAAATGGLEPAALYLFAVVFFWTPPHFWALALLIKDDYARTGVPMLPVVSGDATTRRQILAYAVLLTAITVLPFVTGLFGVAYLAAALALGGAFISLAAWLTRHPSRRAALRVYLASLLYLALLFTAMAVDRVF